MNGIGTMGAPAGGMQAIAGGGGGYAASAPPPPPGPPGGGASGGDFPSMAELARNQAAGTTGGTIKDQEVKVVDPSGRPLADVPRFPTFEATGFPDSIQGSLRKAGFPA